MCVCEHVDVDITQDTVHSTQYTALYCYCNIHTTVQYYAVL